MDLFCELMETYSTIAYSETPNMYINMLSNIYDVHGDCDAELIEARRTLVQGYDQANIK